MKRIRTVLTALVTVVAALAIPSEFRAVPQNQPQQKQDASAHTPAGGDYNFLIGSGFLCDAGGCPAVARASTGETIEISGAGSLGSGGTSVTASGTFTEKTPDGYVVISGVWTATGLVSFDPYGLDPTALQREYPQFRALPVGKIPPPLAAIMTLPVAAGGLAVIRIRLLPDAGTPADAVLRVNCAKGNVPPDASGDGVKLFLDGGSPVFDEQVRGRTLFLLRRPGPNFGWKQAPGSQKP
jgi:hypothetical protein